MRNIFNSSKYIAILLFFLLSTFIIPVNAELPPIKVYFNTSPVNFDVDPYISEGRTMVEVRAIFEAMDARLSFDAANKKVTAVNPYGDNIELFIDHAYAYANGYQYLLDSPVVIKNGRTMVPLRFIPEAFSAYVDWNDATRSISIMFRYLNKEVGPKYFINIIKNGTYTDTEKNSYPLLGQKLENYFYLSQWKEGFIPEEAYYEVEFSATDKYGFPIYIKFFVSPDGNKFFANEIVYNYIQYESTYINELLTQIYGY